MNDSETIGAGWSDGEMVHLSLAGHNTTLCGLSTDEMIRDVDAELPICQQCDQAAESARLASSPT